MVLLCGNLIPQVLDKICKSWNIAIRTILRLPYNAHTCYLGPLIGQYHIRTQLYARNFKFLFYAYRSPNVIVKTCINNAMYNANTPIGYKLSFYKNTFQLDMNTKLNVALKRIHATDILDIDHTVIVNGLNDLINVRSGHSAIDQFTIKNVTSMIDYFSTV